MGRGRVAIAAQKTQVLALPRVRRSRSVRSHTRRHPAAPRVRGAAPGVLARIAAQGAAAEALPWWMSARVAARPPTTGLGRSSTGSPPGANPRCWPLLQRRARRLACSRAALAQAARMLAQALRTAPGMPVRTLAARARQVRRDAAPARRSCRHPRRRNPRHRGWCCRARRKRSTPRPRRCDAGGHHDGRDAANASPRCLPWRLLWPMWRVQCWLR